MRRLGSLVMRAAEPARVPAGAALAVDRESFRETVTRALAGHPLITFVREEVAAVPPQSAPGDAGHHRHGPADLRRAVAPIQRVRGRASTCTSTTRSVRSCWPSRSTGRKVFRASRWGRSLRRDPAGGGSARTETAPGVALETASDGARAGPACGVDDGEGDYLNCPITKRRVRARSTTRSCTRSRRPSTTSTRSTFFEGCLPIEVMAHRGRDTLRFGPMKPVGLDRSAHRPRPYAVVQLRQDNLAGDHFSLVGFQTQFKWGEQARVLRMIPGLEQAEFVRFGMVHRNTYINGPDGARPNVADRSARRRCSSPGRSPASKATWSRRPRACSPGCNAAALVAGPRRPRRRARPPSARWRTTCRTPTPRTTSRPTSRSASCRRSTHAAARQGRSGRLALRPRGRSAGLWTACGELA